MANVAKIGGRGGAGSDDGHTRLPWLRRQAAQIVGQLPDDDEEALEVLQIARQLIELLRLTRRV
jgi:hypothetical protein